MFVSFTSPASAGAIPDLIPDLASPPGMIPSLDANVLPPPSSSAIPPIASAIPAPGAGMDTQAPMDSQASLGGIPALPAPVSAPETAFPGFDEDTKAPLRAELNQALNQLEQAKSEVANAPNPILRKRKVKDLEAAEARVADLKAKLSE